MARKPKTLYGRLNEVLADPGSERGEWSSTRFFLFFVIGTFLGLAAFDVEFRDPAAFVTIILALIGAVVAPKLLDLRVGIGQAAAAIGSKFITKKQETVTSSEETETVKNGETVKPEPPAERE